MNGLKIVQTAIGELGYSESPPESNMTKYGEFYGMNGVPWCAIWVSWVYAQTNIPLGHIDSDKGMYYTPSALNHFKQNGEVVTSPLPGDIVFFDWQGDGKVDHVGLFLQDYDKISFFSLEGNTAIGNNSNGGQVMLRLRRYKNAIFVHPRLLND